MQLPPAGRADGLRYCSQLALSEDAINLVHMDISPALFAVQERVGRVLQRRRLVKTQDGAAMLDVIALQAIQLPPLALVAPKVVHIE